jgi:hypothetical protein
LTCNEPHSDIEPLNRQLTHFAGHIGQIVLLAKQLAFDHWQSLSIPRGQLAQFNAEAQPKRCEVWESVRKESAAG